MIVRVVMNLTQKEALIKASQAVGLSYSSFMRQAAIEKIERMNASHQISNNDKR